MSDDQPRDALRAATAEPHERVLTALQDAEAGARVAVTWCSAHVVASERVLLRAAMLRHVPGVRRHVRTVRTANHRLQGATFRLDRRTTGDVGLAAVPVERLAREVRDALRAHVDAEDALVKALRSVLSPSEQQDLAARLESATASAPTRAHPYTWHTPASALLDRLQASVDRVRDVLDNRAGITGRPVRPARPLGRWGSYATAAPYGGHEEEERRDEG